MLWLGEELSVCVCLQLAWVSVCIGGRGRGDISLQSVPHLKGCMWVFARSACSMLLCTLYNAPLYPMEGNADVSPALSPCTRPCMCHCRTSLSMSAAALVYPWALQAALVYPWARHTSLDFSNNIIPVFCLISCCRARAQVCNACVRAHASSRRYIRTNRQTTGIIWFDGVTRWTTGPG